MPPRAEQDPEAIRLGHVKGLREVGVHCEIVLLTRNGRKLTLPWAMRCKCLFSMTIPGDSAFCGTAVHSTEAVGGAGALFRERESTGK